MAKKVKVGRPRKEKVDVPITCFITKEQDREIRSIAVRDDVSISSEMKRAVKFYLSYRKEMKKVNE